RRRSRCETTETRWRVFPLRPRPSTMQRTVLGKPGLITAEENDEAPQVEALVSRPGTVAVPEMLDVAKVEEVELAGFLGKETFLGPRRQGARQPGGQRYAESLLGSM